MTEKTPKASVIDLFCGAGGLSYGFREEGFDVVAGIDADETCRYAYETNIKAPFLRQDVSSLTSTKLNKLYPKHCHTVLVGCAPCQPFSAYNCKNKDQNWKLVRDFGRLIAESLPDVVSMENVPRLCTFRGGEVFRDFTQTLRSAGYDITFDVLSAADYGLAQTRSRLVLLASRRGQIKLPSPTHKDSHRTVDMVIGKLPALAAGETNPAD